MSILGISIPMYLMMLLRERVGLPRRRIWRMGMNKFNNLMQRKRCIHIKTSHLSLRRLAPHRRAPSLCHWASSRGRTMRGWYRQLRRRGSHFGHCCLAKGGCERCWMLGGWRLAVGAIFQQLDVDRFRTRYNPRPRSHSRQNIIDSQAGWTKRSDVLWLPL